MRDLERCSYRLILMECILFASFHTNCALYIALAKVVFFVDSCIFFLFHFTGIVLVIK